MTLSAKLANINLAVADPARSLNFYRAVLGARQTERSAPPGFIQIQLGDEGPTLGLQ